MLKLFVTALVFLASPVSAQQLRPNLVYSAQGQQLDLFMPDGKPRKTALLFIHGGGFREGDKSRLAGFARLYAQGGFISATMNYRLAPANPYPAAVDDVKAAINFMQTQAGSASPLQVVVIGYSAGGTLALSAGLSGENRVAAIVSAAGVADFDAWAAATLYDQAKKDIKNYLGDASARQASPVYAVRPNAPPVFLFYGGKDNLVPVAQSVLMAEALKAQKIPVLFRVIPKAGHDILLTSKYVKQVLHDLTPFLVAIDQQAM